MKNEVKCQVSTHLVPFIEYIEGETFGTEEFVQLLLRTLREPPNVLVVELLLMSIKVLCRLGMSTDNHKDIVEVDSNEHSISNKIITSHTMNSNNERSALSNTIQIRTAF
jgi:hypothetical protein